MLDLQLDHISYVGIILVLVLTGSGLPLPEEVPIVAAGYGASIGTLNPWGAFLACLVGALAGDAVLYTIGYYFGHSLIIRHPWFARLLHAEREAKIEQMIRKHGLKVFFLARFMVGIRAPVYLAAGVLRMPFKLFLLIDAVCASSVVGLFFGLSYAYGEHLASLIRPSEIGFTVVVGVGIAVVVCYFLLKRRRAQRLAGALGEKTDEAVAVGAPDSKDLHA